MKSLSLLPSLIGVTALLLATSVPAYSDIVRHCSGWIGARILSGVDKNGKRFTMRVNRSLGVVQVNGRGTCRGKAWANDCRRNARGAIIHCGRGLWADRWNRRIPGHVCESADNSRPPHAGIQTWTKYPGDIKKALEHAACCRLIPKARQLNFAVYLSISGDTRCPHREDLERVYKADCRALRKQGLC